MGRRRAMFALSLALVACRGPDSIFDAGIRDGGLPDRAPLVDAGPPPPATLSETGLFASGIEGPLAEGVRPYDVRFPLFSDGLEKRRFLLLPEGRSIDTSDPDHWSFPIGTRLWKQFLRDGVPLETRLLIKIGEGRDRWIHVAYVHRADGRDADPVPLGETDVLGTTHDVPSQEDCESCHLGGADFVLGVGAMQLTREVFDAWVLDGALPSDARFADPPGAETERSALGYLHGNCGHCHSDVHPLSSFREMRLFLPVDTILASEAPAVLTTRGVSAHHDLEGVPILVSPRDPNASQLYVRAGRRDALGMPPLGSEDVDIDGQSILRAWILGGP